jgi:hypothetical protein
MQNKTLEISGQPAYVESWSVAAIPNFVATALERWQRNFGRLPSQFLLVVCPQVEVNAAGGLPGRVRELTDPRVRLLHFTSCHKPYLVILLLGDDAEPRRGEIQKLLAWSEGYEVEIDTERTRLLFLEATEHTD